MPITFSSPRAQPEVIHFWCQMKAHVFLIVNPKFQLQILCSFGDTTQNANLNGISENNFLCVFITASPRGAYFLLPLYMILIIKQKINKNAMKNKLNW